MIKRFANPSPLYSWEYEHDSCGVGFIANMRGERSYTIIDRAVAGLKNLAHRGAIDADAVTGDGSGILTQIPYELFREYLKSKGKQLFRESDLAVCVVFLPRNDEYAEAHGRKIIRDAIEGEDLAFLAWREVPVNPSCLGKTAELSRPLILQALVGRMEKEEEEEDLTEEEEAEVFERSCFLAMKMAEKKAAEENFEDFYIVSFSSRTITYKGLLSAPQIRRFFLDLRSPLYTSAFAIFHQRFATNTIPDWTRAQPYRMLAHNGEINTIRGNRNLMRARGFASSFGIWNDRFADLHPIIQPEMSDSASFDNALQLITLSGRSSVESVSMMMPASWEKDKGLPQEVRDFFYFHSTMIEPWDGPCAIVFTDGRFVGASLDRSGLRPLRYKVYDDGTIIMASEAGIVPDWGAKVVTNGRLGPSRMVAVDLQEKKLLEDDARKSYLATLGDFGKWCRDSLHNLHDLAKAEAEYEEISVEPETVESLQVVFGYHLDERELVLMPMVETGMEPLGSMGDDTPLAVLSRRPRLLYTYFKQLFAQVTNPAIDSTREHLMMSLNMYLGGRLELFEVKELPHDREFLELETPILLNHEYRSIYSTTFLRGRILKLDAVFEASEGEVALEAEIQALKERARTAVEVEGARVIVVSDRMVSGSKAPIPMLLAVGAVHQELVRTGHRLRADIVAETGEARDVHQIACLVGFGANAVYPYLAFDVIRTQISRGEGPEGIEIAEGLGNYRNALDKGLLKIMSKMGIGTLFSYQGAQIFEAIGLDKKLVEDCFYGTPSPIGGISYGEIAEEVLVRHGNAYPQGGEPAAVESDGYFKAKRNGGEFHSLNPKVVSGMNRFLRKSGFEGFELFKTASDEHVPVAPRDLLKFKFADEEIPLDNVEPVEEIRRRFTTAGMSFGALSPEAHECLAIAMNSIGGKSNCGEGGEDPRRFSLLESGENANSAIKQVASGRFGVTAEYLANAKEIEIKIAQGAKPGEGGQIPGHKVSEIIARLRYSVPGVPLISPPPHHDIYSIEDLAQLIFDLKEVNPRAKVCVKLVSSSGVGTIAVGVAKAYADIILISGHEGGTGASPISSIKNAGSAWEIGISEVHQILMMNGLRNRVTLRTDGGMRTGRDIVFAAILGAEEYNFGTAALIAAGCAMFRVCHLNTCPVGVATQDEELRVKFRGKAENVVRFFNAVAEDVRRYLAKLGYRMLNDVIGRTELVEQIEDPENPKTKKIDLSPILYNPDPSGDFPRVNTRSRNDSPGHEGSLDHQILQDARSAILQKCSHYSGTYKINNTHRDVGARLSGEIAYMYGNRGLKQGSLDLTFRGSAGQSFGAFLVPGIHLRLVGEANDYVGKGMHGGEIIIRPNEEEEFAWHENFIVGNTCIYGATGGFIFAAGRTGQRFAVRNSGATAVVEGVGDHGCEYMTRGTVVVLGPTGRNFGAGMSGGLAFVYDSDLTFKDRINPEMVKIEGMKLDEEVEELHKLIELYAKLTGSPVASEILRDWEGALLTFRKVIPNALSTDTAYPQYQFDIAAQALAV